jgi:tetratricopeptide (TPR) repeat protein
MSVRFRYLLPAIFCTVLYLGLAGVAVAQQAPPVEQVPTDKSAPPPKNNVENPPRSNGVPAGESSSKQTEINIAPPANDAKSHPNAGFGDNAGPLPYDPMKAMKDVEVGDFYYKKDNYKAAISRYREALQCQPHYAEATFHLAEAMGKSGDTSGATENYKAYLKMLPNGPDAKKAKKALERLSRNEARMSEEHASHKPKSTRQDKSPGLAGTIEVVP